MNPKNERKEEPILTLIQQIKDGRTDPETIDKDTRQQCIEVFIMEGCSVSAIAQIFKKCDKTIRRDLEEIRARNAVTPSVDMAKRIIGEFLTYSRVHIDHLMRLARTKDTSVSERAQAEYFAHRVMVDRITKLQTLGYLPLKPQQIIADISHHTDDNDEKSYVELRSQLEEIERVSKGSGELTPEMIKELESLKDRLERAEIQDKLTKIAPKNKEGEKDNEKL